METSEAKVSFTRMSSPICTLSKRQPASRNSFSVAETSKSGQLKGTTLSTSLPCTGLTAVHTERSPKGASKSGSEGPFVQPERARSDETIRSNLRIGTILAFLIR